MKIKFNLVMLMWDILEFKVKINRKIYMDIIINN